MFFATAAVCSSSTVVAVLLPFEVAPPSVIDSDNSGRLLRKVTACLRCAWLSPVVAVWVTALAPTRGTPAASSQQRDQALVTVTPPEFE